MPSVYQNLHGMPTSGGFAPPPLSLLTLLPPCQDELYNVGHVQRPPFVRTARSSDAPLQKLSHSASSIFASSTSLAQDVRGSARHVARKRRSSDPRRHSPSSNTPNHDHPRQNSVPHALRNAISSRFIRRGRAIEKEAKGSASTSVSHSSIEIKVTEPAISSCTNDSSSDLSLSLCQSHYEKHVHHSADDLWHGTVDPINAFMDILRSLESDSATSKTIATDETGNDSTSTELLSNTVSIPRRSKLKLWLRVDKEGRTSESYTRSGSTAPAAADEQPLNPASPSSIWPIDETLAVENENRITRQRVARPPRRSSACEIEWGSAAKQIWGNEHGHRHRKDIIPEVPHACQSDFNNVWLSWALNTPQVQDKTCEACETDPVPRRPSLNREVENILATDTPQLRSWNAFENAYINSLLNLSETPVKPIGVPPFPCCPNATPLAIGHLAAPQPPWEIQRLRTMYRMDIFTLPAEVCAFISGLLDDCAESIGVQTVMLHFLDRAALYRLTAEGIVYDERSRAASVAGHMFLNRNNGLIIRDLQQDWRFKAQETYERFFRFYAGMPVLAANGLPVAALSAVDLSPRDDLDVTHELRQLSIFVGSVLEAHYRKRWSHRVCTMAQHLHQLRHLLLLEHDFAESLSASNGREQKIARPQHETAVGLYDPYVVADMGLHMNAVDVRSLESVLSTVVSDTRLEIACLLLLRLDKVQAEAAILCLHEKEADETIDQAHARIYSSSNKFMKTLFESRDGTKSKKRSSLLGESKSEDFILRQNVCPVLPKMSHRPLDEYHTSLTEPDAGPWIELSEEEVLMRRTESSLLHPLLGPTASGRFRASLTVRIAKRGHLGLALSILTRRADRIIGVEDLRYIEALRPFLASAFYRYTLDDPSTIKTPRNRNNPADIGPCESFVGHLRRTSSTRSARSVHSRRSPALHRAHSSAFVEEAPSHRFDVPSSPTSTTSPSSAYASRSGSFFPVAAASSTSLQTMSSSQALQRPSHEASLATRESCAGRSPRTDSNPSSPLGNDCTGPRKTPPRSLPPVPRSKKASVVRENNNNASIDPSFQSLDTFARARSAASTSFSAAHQRAPSMPTYDFEHRAQSQKQRLRPMRSKNSSFLSLDEAGVVPVRQQGTYVGPCRGSDDNDSDEDDDGTDECALSSTPLALSLMLPSRPDSSLTIQARSLSDASDE